MFKQISLFDFFFLYNNSFNACCVLNTGGKGVVIGSEFGKVICERVGRSIQSGELLLEVRVCGFMRLHFCFERINV